METEEIKAINKIKYLDIILDSRGKLEKERKHAAIKG
jgi:hypothetical protein